MLLRGFSPRTQEAYVGAVCQLARFFDRSPDTLSDEEIRVYLLHLAEGKRLAASSRNQATCAFRFFYGHVLGRPVDNLKRVLPWVRREVRRAQVFAVSELEQLFTNGCSHPRHRAYLMTVYGAGLRLEESCHLRPEDILSARHQIRVVAGKGKKNRYTLRAS